MHAALSPTAFAAHVARQRVLTHPDTQAVIADIAVRIRRMSDRIVAEDLIFARAAAKAIVRGVQCIWVAADDGGAFEPLPGMSEAEIGALTGRVGL